MLLTGKHAPHKATLFTLYHINLSDSLVDLD